MTRPSRRFILFALWLTPTALCAEPAVSFTRHIRPILQTHCLGCHQPAKASGGYVMTEFAKLAAGGDSGEKGFVAGKTNDGEILARVHGRDGKAKMPPKGPGLTEAEIQLLERWVRDGAKDDSPAATGSRYDPEHPPVYTRPPVVTAMDVSPDGQLIAVAGFHEALLHRADGSGLTARLVGMSERLESLRFSPDGKSLAITGGSPGRMGEVQIWDVAKAKLKLSIPVTYDTVYGVSWSPDGSKVAFGCADNTVRAIDANNGQQVLYQGAHNDWALDTVFSVDGSHLVSVGRDRAAKLIEFATQRFVDNITSITPGALKGGLQAVARHPTRDEIVVGGSDGQPKVYRMHRVTNRVIGDDSNLIRELPALKGRVFDVAVSRDGKRIAAGGGLDGSGEVGVYGYDFDTTMPDDVKKIMAKVVSARSAEERKRVEAHHVEGVKRISVAKIPAGVYAVAFATDGRYVYAAGSDGMVRVVHAETGEVEKSFGVAPGVKESTASTGGGNLGNNRPEDFIEPEPMSAASIVGLSVTPTEIILTSPFETVQLLVTGISASGDRIDMTRRARYTTPVVADISRTGLVRAMNDGAGTIEVTVESHTVKVPVRVDGKNFQPDFIRDVNPALSKMGCNAGTCHGSKDGKNGFKLSLRGYDPVYDVRAFTDDHASRRVSVASPDDSLMLLKATGSVPHVGGQLTTPNGAYYGIVRDWIAGGAKLKLDTPRVTKIDVEPVNPVVQTIGERQQLRVVATYADGTRRDVTREAFLESGNTEVAKANRSGLMTTLRRGEAPVLARYEGAYAATMLTVMGERTGFAWVDPPKYNAIDEHTAAKWKRMMIQPSDVCTDAEYLRRVHLDLTGLPPEAEAVKAFLADPRDSRVKRDEVVDKLIGTDAYVEHWANKWSDLLQVNRKFLGTEGSKLFRDWIRAQVARNVPYDEFVRSILTASGSNMDNPAASYFKILRSPEDTMENTTHLFLAVRFNCNKCHDHPFERWTQDQYYQTAAYFARYELARDPKSGDKNIGGTAVEGAKPLYEIVSDKNQGEVKHDRTGELTPPAFPYPAKMECPPDASRRAQFAAWVTSADNHYFARSFVNRLWGYTFGVGVIDPIDDVRAGNPPSNPELLDYLTKEFVNSNFNVQHVLKLITKSRTYQLSIVTNKWNEDDKLNYSHAAARRLPAEVIYDAVHAVTGAPMRIPGVPAGTRAAALPDSGVELPSGFLATLGRPARESACECERTNSLQLGPVMALVSGPVVTEAIGDPNNALAKLTREVTDDRALINELFVRIVNRPAAESEVVACLKLFESIGHDHEKLVASLKSREAEWAAIKPGLEKQRAESIAKAKAELGEYMTHYTPRRQQMEQERLRKIEAAKSEVEAARSQVQARVPELMKKFRPLDWVRLDPKSLKSSAGATLRRESDLSIFASGKDGAGTYKFVADSDTRGITAVRLEALADERIPARGPGRSDGGNFVLSEIELDVSPKGKPGKSQRMKFTKAVADYNQDGYNVSSAINGRAPANNDGWAVYGSTGVDHWAVFTLDKPIDLEGGATLSFTLQQRYSDGKHSLGRFRLSVTTDKSPELGVRDDIAALLKVPQTERTADETNGIISYFAGHDPQVIDKSKRLAEAQQQLPADARLEELKTILAELEKPIPEDPRLAQLKRDVRASDRQLAAKRLTATQDVAWALINSPAFLFNR